MPFVTCFCCNARINAPPAAIGKKAKCPQCGERITLQLDAEPIEEVEQLFVGAPVADVTAPVNPVVVYRDERPIAPAEPWYYALLWGCAAFVLGVVVLSFLGVAVLLGIATIGSGQHSGEAAAGVGILSIWVLMLLAPSLVITAFYCVLLMLLVDVARNIRGIRYRE